MLTTDGVTLHYGAAQILFGISLEVKPASVTCLMGRNGVGKTSLLKAVAGHQPVSDGTIAVNERPVERLAAHKRAAIGIAYVPQGRDIFPLLTVRENLQIGFGLLTKAERMVPDFIFELFPVLKQMLDRRGGDLSGGQQQQLAIARALVTRPDILLLDEPTEGIQPSVIKDIGRAIEFLRKELGLAILLVEQYMAFCRQLADNLYIMDRGRIVHKGIAEDLDDADVRKHLSV